MYKRRLAVVASCAFAVALVLSFAWRTSKKYGPIAGHTARGGHVSALARSLRPDYPYSVIPGGAYSRAELHYAINHDPVVQKHYSDFDSDNVQLVTLTADRYEYASYRIKNRIYWTKKRLRLRKGEVLLTDGTHYARTRCGNRLSEKRQGPTSNLEPPEAALDLPPFAPPRLYTFQLAEAPPPGVLQQANAPQPSDLSAAVLPRTSAPVGSSDAWPALNRYMFPTVFTPGFLYQLPQSNSTPPPNSPPNDGGTPPPGTPPPNSPPPLVPIPEPATISLALACLAGLLLGGRMLAVRRARRSTEGGTPPRP